MKIKLQHTAKQLNVNFGTPTRGLRIASVELNHEDIEKLLSYREEDIVRYFIQLGHTSRPVKEQANERKIKTK